MTNKLLSVEYFYLYADYVFGYENWSHEIKNQTIGEQYFLKCVLNF